MNSFTIFSLFSSMRLIISSLGTRERSIFGTHTLAPTTGSPSTLFVGSGFRGHLVGIY